MYQIQKIILYLQHLQFHHLEYGKTTIIRDLIRKISTGIEKNRFKGINVGLVDERGEIAAMYKGIPQNDRGIRTDVLDNIPKAIRNENVNQIYGSKGNCCR